MANERLKEMYDEQRDFQKNFFDPDNVTKENRIFLTKENILSIHRELGEVLNEIPWKLHRANDETYSIDSIQEELIDCMKLLMNVCVLWNMTDEDIYQIFMNKSKIVRERYAKEKDNIKGYDYK